MDGGEALFGFSREDRDRLAALPLGQPQGK
jgi:hypothetical protein